MPGEDYGVHWLILGLGFEHISARHEVVSGSLANRLELSRVRVMVEVRVGFWKLKDVTQDREIHGHTTSGLV